MFQAKVLDVITGLYRNEPVAALVVNDVSGSVAGGDVVTLNDADWEVLSAFPYRPETDLFETATPPLHALVIRDGDALFESLALVRGAYVTSRAS